MIITKKGINDRVIFIEETFRAPRDKVFKAWTKPESLKKWFMADEGVVVTDAAVHFEVGGTYFIEAMFPGFDPTRIEGAFLKVIMSEVLEYTWLTPVLKGRTTKVKVTFQDQDQGSKIHLYHAEFENENEMQLHIDGWKNCLAKLNEHLESL